MRAPLEKQEDFQTSFPPRRVAVVKVKCLLLAAIETIDKLHRKETLPYSASLNVINNLFDCDFEQKAFREIRDFGYRLSHENHPCGEQAEDYIQQMIQTIDKAHLLVESDS
jgi:hypothetical protein